MDEQLNFNEMDNASLETRAKSGDATAAYKLGSNLKEECFSRTKTDGSCPLEIWQQAEQWLLKAYDSSPRTKVASWASLALSGLYGFEAENAPLYSEEKEDLWREKYFLMRMQEQIETSLNDISESSGIVRNLILEQAKSEGEEKYEKIGKKLLNWADDVVTPDVWKTHGYGTLSGRHYIYEEFNDFLNEKLKKIKADMVLGDSRVHDVLWLLSSEQRSQIKAELIKTMHGDIASMMSEYAFTFDDIVRLDDRSVQKVLREIDSQELAKALKLASKEVIIKFTQNMSQRAACMLEEDMEFMGPVRRNDALEAQSKICAVVQRLSEAEEITIPSEAGDLI